MSKKVLVLIGVCIILLSSILAGCSSNSSNNSGKATNEAGIYSEVKNNLTNSNEKILKALVITELKSFDYSSARATLDEAVKTNKALVEKLEEVNPKRGYEERHKYFIGLLKREIHLYSLLGELIISPYNHRYVLSEVKKANNEIMLNIERLDIEGLDLSELKKTSEFIIRVEEFGRLVKNIPQVTMDDITFMGLNVDSKAEDVQAKLKSTAIIENIPVNYNYTGSKAIAELYKTYDEGIGLVYLKTHQFREASSMAKETRFIDRIYITKPEVKTVRGISLGDSIVKMFYLYPYQEGNKFNRHSDLKTLRAYRWEVKNRGLNPALIIYVDDSTNKIVEIYSEKPI